MGLLHDGDGTDVQPYACARCDCAWIVGVGGDPERIVLDDA
jgi:hypothetical protein